MRTVAGGFYGADVAELRQLADRLGRAAASLESAGRLLTHQVTTTTQWRGRDAEAFRGQWDGTYRPSVTAVAAGLRRASEALARNAVEQEDASRAGGATALGGESAGRVFPIGGGVQIDSDVVVPLLGLAAAGSAAVALGARAVGEGSAQIGPDGANASVRASAMAGVSGEASEAAQLGLLSGKVGVKALAGAAADVEAGVAIGLDGVRGHLGGSAFAGIEASAEASVEVGGVEAGVEGGVMAGVGVRADARVEMTMDKISVDFDLGAAIGIGAYFSPHIEFSPSELIHDLGSIPWNPTTWF